MKFYYCKHCGNVIAYTNYSGVDVVCCGDTMQELVPSSTDAAVEKHVPVVTTEGNMVTVKVGEVAHPMTEQHYIQWIALETQNGHQRKVLLPGAAPEACFCLCEGDEFVAAYAYCNLHGLWKS